MSDHTPSQAQTQQFKHGAWTPEEDAILLSLYFTHERREVARILNRTYGSLRKRCSVLGLNQKHPHVTDDDRAIIRKWYEDRVGNTLEDFSLNDLAAQLGRTKAFVSRLAGQMGLTLQGRRIGAVARRRIGDANHARIQEKGHPRGMLGKTHTEANKLAHSVWMKAFAISISPERREEMNNKQMATKMARYGTGNPGMLQSSNPYSRTKSGKRADLNNRFFRSSWEANYARYLNWLIEQGEIKAWEFECQTFVFHGVTRGVLTYTPDFKVYANDGSYEWHEVKGWMDAKSKAKLKRMSKFYPDEKVVVIGAKEYSAIAKWKGLINTWE